MSHLKALLASSCVVAAGFSANAATVTIDPVNLVTNYISLGEWNTNGDFDGFGTVQVVNPAVTGGSLTGDVDDGSSDPKLPRNNFSNLGIDLDSGNYNVIEVRVKRTGTAGRFDIFWGTTSANGIAGTRRVDDQGQLPSDGTFHVIQFDMTGEAAWTSTWDDIRIDPFRGLATGGRSFEIDYVRVGTPVPEPGSFALIGLGGLCLLRRRR